MDKKIFAIVSVALTILLLATANVGASHESEKKTTVIKEGYFVEARWVNANGGQSSLYFDKSTTVTDFLLSYCLTSDYSTCKYGFLKIQKGEPSTSALNFTIDKELDLATITLDKMPAHDAKGNAISLNDIRIQINGAGTIVKKCDSYTEKNNGIMYRIKGCTWSRSGAAIGYVDGIYLTGSELASLVVYKTTRQEIPNKNKKKNNKK